MSSPPSARGGPGSRVMCGSLAVPVASARALESTPGQMSPPTKASPSTQSKVVAVPKSTTMRAGASHSSRAA